MAQPLVKKDDDGDDEDDEESPPAQSPPSSSSPPPPPPPSSSSSQPSPLPPPLLSSPPPSSTQSPPPLSSPHLDSKSPPQLSPPPSSNSPSQSSPPPSNPNPSPLPSQNNPSNPPSGGSNNGSPTSGSSSNNNGNNNSNNNTQWLPPPDSTSSNNPPNSNVSGSLSPPSDSPSKNNGSSMLSIPLVALVGAGVVLLVLLLLLVFVACRRKRHREQNNEMPYYNNRPNAAGYYDSTATPSPQPRTKWQWGGGGGGGGGDDPFYKSTAQNQNHNNMHANNHDQLNDLPQLPGGRSKAGWHKPPLPLISSDRSHTSSSGLDGPVLPPPPPIVALGLNQISFTYEELSAATGGFSESNLLGQGGFGYVHRGTLPNGKEIAVKSLKLGSGQGEREFKAEVEIICRVHHRHLVSLVGFCIAGGKRLLVYEYVPNNSLEYHLHGKGHPIMDWPMRLKVALGAAKGLAYLHEDCHPRIIHRDIKSSNILIDFACEAKVADFGLAKLTSDNNTHVSTRVMGTFGYLAPEYASTGKLTEKSDVFSFGVVLLELITGRRPVDPTCAMEDSLVDWARPLCLHALEDRNFNELADPYLEKKYPVEEMACMVACAGAAVRHSARRRPKISQIVRALESDVSFEDFNSDLKPSRALIFGGGSASSLAMGNTTSVDEDNSLYTEGLKKLKKVAGENAGSPYLSSEYEATSEYGLNPSSSSSEFESQGHSPHK